MRGVREGFSEEMAQVKRLQSFQHQGKSVSGRGRGKCKDPEARVSNEY